MDNILEIDEKSLTVTAQADQCQQLEWALNEKGLTLPITPPRRFPTLADPRPRALAR